VLAGPPIAACRLVREPLPCTLAAERAALLLAGDDGSFALVGRWAGGGAIVGSEPLLVVEPGGGVDPFELIAGQPTVADARPGAVGGGWFGYLGYRLGATIEALDPGPPAGPDGLPAFALAFHDHVVRLDPDGRWWFEALWTDARDDALRARLDTLRRRAAEAGERGAPGPPEPAFEAAPSPAGHAAAVAAARERIHAGDLLQANLALRLTGAAPQAAAPVLFTKGATALRPDRAALLTGPWGAVVSLSPELFLTRAGRHVRSAPIKGTAAERDTLAASAKDHAENAMIVDLVRNDLGRVCVPGSVTVDALAQARPHAGVWHLVSEVSGELRDGVGDAELLRATFPPGSVTGAPKVAAMNVIAELESAPRDVFTGAIGFASPLAGLELSVAIRTFELRRGTIALPVGGGIVADSDPMAEARECLLKAGPPIAAIGGALAAAHAGGAAASAPALLRLGPRPVPRPDPRAGVFETILVRNGHAVGRDGHLDRLRASLRDLYGTAPPGELADRVDAAAAAAGGPARLRVTVRPDRAAVATIEVTGLALPRPPVALRTICVPGGLGAHKWADRRLLDALAARVAPEQPLLCDLDGRVLEAARANVFALLDGGTLVTSPLDGRILPGVTRGRVLAAAAEAGVEVAERPLVLPELARAREAFVTGALGGLEPVASLDGAPLPSAGLAARLASAFRG